MIEIESIVPWSALERTAYPAFAAAELHIAASRLTRSVRFYSRVFGLRAVRTMAGGQIVVMRGAAEADFVIHDANGAVRQRVPYARRWGFSVANLERVRQQAWELGVGVARDSGAPDHIYRWANGRSLYVRAPDGIEIELVEIFADASSAPQASDMRKAV